MTGKSLGSLDEALPRLRWGIIGTGVIASHFAEDIFAQHGSPATAVLSRDLARAKMFGARAGVLDDALCTDNFDKFAAAIDIAYIASPHTDHAKDALRCLRANLHVLVEKPLALTAQGAEAIFAEAEKRQRFAMEAMWTRFIPAFASVSSEIASGVLGNIKHVRIDHGFDGSSAPSRLTDPALAGGAWYDLGSYVIACSHAMLGRPCAAPSIEAVAVIAKHATGVDATTEGQISFGHGAGSCSFRVSLADGCAKNNLVAIGDLGSVVIEAPYHHPSAYIINGARVEMPIKGHGLWYQAKEVERCVASGALQSDACTWNESKSWATSLQRVAEAAGIPSVPEAVTCPLSTLPLTPTGGHAGLRVAVIGLGRIGRMHKATLESLGVRKIIGVDIQDPLPLKGDVDAAVIASWSSAHEGHIRHFALTCGIPVFCEKPLTDSWSTSVSLARDLTTAGATSLVQIGFQRRFDPPLVKAAMAKESLGSVYTVRIDSRDPEPPSPEYMAQMGSHFYDMTIHDFDEARWLLGQEPVSVKATLTRNKMCAHVELRCSSGALATIINDRCCALGYDQRAEIFCERGRVANDSLPTNPSDFFLERYKAAYEAALNDFLVRVVEGKAPPLVGIKDALYAALLARCADESVLEGRTVDVPHLPEGVCELTENTN